MGRDRHRGAGSDRDRVGAVPPAEEAVSAKISHISRGVHLFPFLLSVPRTTHSPLLLLKESDSTLPGPFTGLAGLQLL